MNDGQVDRDLLSRFTIGTGGLDSCTGSAAVKRSTGFSLPLFAAVASAPAQLAMGLLHTILSYVEAFLGWLFYNFRGRDAKLFTRLPLFNNVPKVVKVTSALGASEKTVLPIQYSAVLHKFLCFQAISVTFAT